MSQNVQWVQISGATYKSDMINGLMAFVADMSADGFSVDLSIDRKASTFDIEAYRPADMGNYHESEIEEVEQ